MIGENVDLVARITFFCDGFEFESFNLLKFTFYYQTLGERMERICLGGEK
jgi:hypothetical protein